MIDFSGLDKITGTGKENREAEKKAVAGLEERYLNREKDAIASAREAYKAYEENVRKSSTIRSEIMKGVKAGEDIQDLFLKAVKCIELMTGDTAFYKQTEEALKEKY